MKTRPSSHKKTLRFKPNEELVLVRQISNKSADNGENWRRKLSQTNFEENLARRERTREKMIEKQKNEIDSDNILLPLLDAIKHSSNSELRSVRGMKLTKKRRDMLEKLFQPHSKEKEDEIASTLINVSRSKNVPLATVFESVKTASQSPKTSILSKMFSSIKHVFGSKHRGGRYHNKTRKMVRL